MMQEHQQQKQQAASKQASRSSCSDNSKRPCQAFAACMILSTVLSKCVAKSKAWQWGPTGENILPASVGHLLSEAAMLCAFDWSVMTASDSSQKPRMSGNRNGSSRKTAVAAAAHFSDSLGFGRWLVQSSQIYH